MCGARLAGTTGSGAILFSGCSQPNDEGLLTIQLSLFPGSPQWRKWGITRR
jgi:hypothetical protein